jgi:hypothetical protein
VPPKNTKKSPAVDYAEVGASGLKRSGGYVQEEFLIELSGTRWKRTLKQMNTNDPVIVGFNRVTEMLVRQTSWHFKAASEETDAQNAKEFYEGALRDMSATWQDTLSEIISFVSWGFQVSEIVYKKREGENSDPSRRSRFNDGLIGWRKFAGRAQETIDRWDFDDNGGIQAAIQVAPPKYATVNLPIDKCLLFRTSANKGNPEGVSVCRGAYVPWYYKTNISRIEAIGIERDLAGYPVMYIPASVIHKGDGDPVYESYKTMVTNIRRDEQEGAVLPSDRYDTGKGELMYELKLLSTGGTRSFDTDKIINRYDQRILMSVLADFLILGHEKVGSFALSSDKTNLFSVALGTYLDSICDVINRHAIPRLHALNGWPAETMPTLEHDDIETPDIMELAEAISKLSMSGFTFTQEEADWVKKQAGLPVIEGGGTPMPKLQPDIVPPQPKTSPQGKQASEKGIVPSDAELEKASEWWDGNAPESAKGLFEAKVKR